MNVIFFFFLSSCFSHFLVCEQPPSAWHGCCLSACEIPAWWISLQRHMSHEPLVGAHERSHRPVASVKSVYSAAPRVSDPNPPHIPATTALLSPYHPTPTPNTSSTPPFILSSLRQSEPKSLYICSTWLLPSIWPTEWLGWLSRSVQKELAEGDCVILWFVCFLPLIIVILYALSERNAHLTRVSLIYTCHHFNSLKQSYKLYIFSLNWRDHHSITDSSD